MSKTLEMVQNRPQKHRGWLKFRYKVLYIFQKYLEGTKTVSAIDLFLKFSNFTSAGRLTSLNIND